MNIRDYIESGILELYAAGDLSASERKEVDSLLAQHTELREELDSIEEALEAYASSYQRTPRKEVLTLIMSKIENTSKPQTISAKQIEMQPPVKSESNMRYLAYAATILLFLSIAINVYYYSKYQGVQVEFAEMREQNTMLADQNTVMQADFNKIKSEMDVIKSPSYVAITMKGMPVSPGSVAVVYWDQAAGKVYVNPNNLPAPGSGKQYQLWALVDGVPIDAGVFDMNGEMQLMKAIPDADAFAVTLEPSGGVPKPTEKIYVVGNV